MRWVLPALALFFSAAPDDAEAWKLYTALREKLDAANTLSLDFTISVQQNTRPDGRVDGSLRIKGKDRFVLKLDGKSNRGPDQDFALSIFSDGTRLVSQGNAPGTPLEAEKTSRFLRQSLAQSLLMPMMIVKPFGRSGALPELTGPKQETVRDGGAETVDGVAARIVQYDLPMEGAVFQAKVWIDPAGPRVLKRELSMAGDRFVLTESFSSWVLEGPLPDSSFVFASLPRLAKARVRQLAQSATLYGSFTGRTPQSMADLVSRPAGLPEAVVWPPGSFVLGGILPKDPWGREFLLRTAGRRLEVASLGADGKAGGSGDDEDVAAEVAPSFRMPVTAPTARLKSHYESRITLHLLAAAVKAYRETTGALPRRKAELLEKGSSLVWPDGNWIPEGKLPLDAWGEEFRLITEEQSARIQVQNPKARLLTPKLLTEEERSALESGAKVPLTETERKAIAALVERLRDDDLDTRQKAQDQLRQWGPILDAALAEHLKTEKDIEARARLEELRQSLPKPVPPWRSELMTLSIGIYGDGQPASMRSNERNGSTTLKTLASAEADFRANDRDWNHVNDFWTADVAGLYTLKDQNGQSIKLIELSVALADAAPLEAGAAGKKLPALSEFGVSKPKAGYWFRAMDTNASEKPPEVLKADTGGEPKMGKVHNTSYFGFCAYPAEYGVSGIRTYILNENNTIFWSDTQGEPVLEWPSDADLAAEWKKLD